MNDRHELADVLRKYLTRSGYSANQLAQLSGVPKSTIVNWLKGRVKTPRSWQDIVALSAVLHLMVGTWASIPT